MAFGVLFIRNVYTIDRILLLIAILALIGAGYLIYTRGTAHPPYETATASHK